MIHAYDDPAAPGDVWVDAWIDGHALEVAICDDGCGMSRGRPSVGLGLGLALMSQVADTLRIESDASRSGMRVQMTFALG